MSGRNWFGGNTEVISESGPRPGTPTEANGPSSIPAPPTGPTPSSPTGSGTYIQRAPSQDPLERSIHNDSEHEKSSDQIIRELKTSNAALLARTSRMETDFMNEVNKVSSSFQEEKLQMEDEIHKKDHQIATMQSSTKDAMMLHKLLDENAAQKDTVADLKKQLYQLQHEVEDAEYEKRDEVDKWGAEKEDLVRELEALRHQIKDMSDRSDQEVHAPVSPDNSASSEATDSWKKLEEAQEALDDSTSRLHDTQSTLAGVENDKKRLTKEHELELAKWKATHIEDQTAWTKRERELMDKIQELEKSSGEQGKVQSLLNEREETIESLRGDIAVLTSDLDNTKVDSVSQEHYRRHEATDLRVLNDAQAAEIQRLKGELDVSDREIVARDELLREQQAELDSRNAARNAAPKEGDLLPKEFGQQLYDARDTIRELREELDAQKLVHQDEVKELRNKVDDIVADRNDVGSRLSLVIEERDEARNLLAGSGDGSRSLQRIRDIVSSTTKERVDLERSFESKLDDLDLEKRSELEKVGILLEEKVQELDEVKEKLRLTESGDELRKLRDKVKHLEGKNAAHHRTKKQLREAQLALVALDDEKNRMEETYVTKVSTLEEEKAEVDRQYRTKLVAADAPAVDFAGTIELTAEVERLNAEVEEKNSSLALLLTKSSGDNVDEVLYKEFVSAKDAEKRLSNQLASSRQIADDRERMLREKLEDRDTTISTLVRSSIAEEHKLKGLRNELDAAKALVASAGATAGDATDPVDVARDATRIEELRITAETHKANEQKLRDEIKVLRKQVFRAEVDVKRATSTREDDTGSDIQEKIQERDAAIANLVKQSLSQEELVSSLRSKIASLEERGITAKASPSLRAAMDDLRRMKKENEIFAAQIIDQDEETESMRTNLADRDAQIASLSQELGSLRRQMTTRQVNTSEVEALRAELDEVQEANATQRDDLRVLRRQLREAKAEADRLDDLKLEVAEARQALEEYRNKAGKSLQEDASSRRQLEDAISEKEVAERRLKEELTALRKQQESTVKSLEEKVDAREEEIMTLKNNFNGSDDKVRSLEAEIDNLHRELDERDAMASDELAIADELEQLKEEREVLIKDVDDLNKELAAFQEDRNNIEEIKERLSTAESGRLSAEQGIIDAYERKLSLLKLDKDVTIDGLRKELTEEKGRNTEDLEDLVHRIKELEMENKDLKDELEAKLELKNTKIFALEQTLGAQEQLVDNMKTEMDQLQTSMTRNSVTRRAEIEEMQQEVVEKTAEITLKDREITAVKMELEEARLANTLGIAKLKDRIASAGMDQPSFPSSTSEPRSDSRLTDVKERLEQVKWRNTQLHEDNQKLRARLEKSETLSKESTNDKHRISALEEEIAGLQERVNELQDELAAFTVRATSAKPPMAERPPSTSRQRQPSLEPKQRTRTAQSASPRRTPSSPGRLRFLKRRTRSKDESEEMPSEDNESTSTSTNSRPKF